MVRNLGRRLLIFLCLSGSAAVAAALVIAPAPEAAAPGAVLPDLVADPPTNLSLSADAAGGTNRLLLRFDGFIHNAGRGAFEVQGHRSSASDPMAVTQTESDSSGNVLAHAPSRAQMIYETADGHNHWHLMRIARYSLWDPSRTAEVAPAAKVGFCLEDSQAVDPGPAPKHYTDAVRSAFCARGNPEALDLTEGVSAGWRDVYDHTLALQWVDVSNVQPGTYWLRADVDPEAAIEESNDNNPGAWAAAPTTIPGYVAGPVAAQTGLDKAVSIALGAQPFGAPGAASYRIESAPAHGTLNVAAGTALSAPTVTYTPATGFSGTDSFTYSTRDATSPFPRQPAVATATVSVAAPPGPAVQISGAPKAVVAGTSIQLHATVLNDSRGVKWSVDGVRTGTRTTGRIGSNGLYKAPGRPPKGGKVTIAARSAHGGVDRRVVRILRRGASRPAPLSATAARFSSRSARLSAPVASRIGRGLILTVATRRAGVVRLSAYAGTRRIGTCATRTPKNRSFTCRTVIPRALKATARIRVVATLRVRGRVVAHTTRRSARVGAAVAHAAHASAAAAGGHAGHAAG